MAHGGRHCTAGPGGPPPEPEAGSSGRGRMSGRADGFAARGGSRVHRLLADAQGYAVRATDGEHLGRLLWLIYELNEHWPAGLRVQPHGQGEPTYSGSWEISMAQVVVVRPTPREVIVLKNPGPWGRGVRAHVLARP